MAASSIATAGNISLCGCGWNELNTHAELRRQNAGTVLGDLDPYRIFAYAFGVPSLERFAWLSREDVQSAFDSLGKQLDMPRPLRERKGFADSAEYEAAYLGLFEVGMPEPPVPLLESSHHRAIPAQQIVLDCVNFYSVLGLRHEGSAFPADHLITQLEFLAAAKFARESISDPERKSELLRLERDFLERHLLLWLPVALKKLERLGPPLFPRLLSLTHELMRNELESLQESGTP